MVVRCHQSEMQFGNRARVGAPVLAALVATLFAGCSADIRRLEQPSLALNEKAPVPLETVGRRNAGAPPVNENAGWPNSGANPNAPRPSVERATVERVSALPEASQPINPSVPFDAPRKAKPAAAASAQPAASIAPGSTVEVQPGETLYLLSKRHNVSIAGLMDLNGLKSATLQPGQKIVLPANARRPLAKPASVATPAAAVGQGPAPIARSATPVATPVAMPVPTAAAATPTDWDGSYVVKAGDSLYGVARAHKVASAELQRVNGIVDPAKMRPGMTLKVPAGSVAAAAVGAPAPISAASAPAPVAPAPVAVAPTAAPVVDAPPRAASTGGVRILNSPAATPPAAPVAATPAPTKVAAVGPVAIPGATKFRWPAKGTTLAGFGKRPDGAHNDGINIAVAAGTDIAAADAGTVAYAGSEIKAYGNLVLIRHEGGWVTAYAHADQLLVKRGDAVTRGQIIAKAGATGTVDQPQVHFELRQGSKPVDPAPHMEK
jgi:murein DD-endopeptidase MepM/ murein hydrolase activator NlpD